MDTKKIIVTREHWDKAAAVAWPIVRGKANVGGYTQHCVLAQALTANGYDVRGCHRRGARTKQGFFIVEGAVDLVRLFDNAETDDREGRPVTVPEFPIEVTMTLDEEV